MDPLTLTVGFVVGAFTGAAGQYLGTKYTDKRRSKEASSLEDSQWADVERRFPAVIAEMKEDVKAPALQSVREFFVKCSGSIINRNEPYFEYHTDKHSDLTAAIRYLEELGYVEDITSSNCPMFRMKESFIDRLRST